MTHILCLETSTDVCSVALFADDRLVDSCEVHEPQAHAAKLSLLVEEGLRQSRVTTYQLSAVAVSEGPGSYTGLRIGVSTAKGLCYALGIPLIAVGTLELMASPFLGGDWLCPMIDARRMEVYCALFDESGHVVEKPHAKVIDSGSFSDVLAARRVMFFGNGAMKCRDVLAHEHAVFVEGVYPRAADMGKLAGERFAAQHFVDLASFEPVYLKEFAAKKARTLI
jgi:tRNA threonylcarbamoyladenosine biosynthesis protein TsaB